MKRIILVILAFLVFAGTAYATDLSFGNIGWGIPDGSSFSQSPDYVAVAMPRTTGAGATQLYFQTPNAGNVSFQLDMVWGCTGFQYDYIILAGLNYTSGGTEVWTNYASYEGDPQTHYLFNASAYSNQGIYRITAYCNTNGLGGALYIYQDSSTFTYNGDPDLTSRTYGAGSYVTIPLLNRYYPQITTISGDPVDGVVTSLGYNTTAEPYYLAPIFLSCSIPAGLSSAYVLNANGTDPAHEWQMYYFNFEATEHKTIGFQYASDSNGSTIYVPVDSSHTFVIGVNNSEALSGVGWYVSRQFADGSFGSSYPVLPAEDKNVSFTYSPHGNYGRFRVEAQLEDTFCIPHRFVTYTWYVTLGASVSLSGYVSTGIMNTPVPNATVEIQCPSGEADKITLTDANGAYSFTGLGAGQYTLNIEKTGYSCAVCPDTFTLNATNQGVNPYNRDYVLTVANVTTTTTPSTDTLRVLNISEFTIGNVFSVWASYKSGGLTISDATCTFTGDNFDPSSGSLEFPGYEKVVEIVGPAGASSYSVTCSKTGHQTLTSSDSFTVHDATDIATAITWISEPREAVVGVFSVYKIWFRTSSTGINGAACSLYANGAEYVMMDQGDGYYSKSRVYSSTGTYKVYVLCSKTNYQSGQTENITTVVSQSTVTTVPNTCSDGIKNNDETDRDCGGSCSKCARNQACKKNTDCLSNWCPSGLCKSPLCSDLIKNGDETGIDCGGSCGPCACFYISQCAQDGSERCVDNVCVRDYC